MVSIVKDVELKKTSSGQVRRLVFQLSKQVEMAEGFGLAVFLIWTLVSVRVGSEFS